MLSRTAIDPGSLACILNGTETTHICPAFPLPGLTHLALIQLDFVLRCMMDWHRVHATLDSRPLQIVLRLETSLLPFFLRDRLRPVGLHRLLGVLPVSRSPYSTWDSRFHQNEFDHPLMRHDVRRLGPWAKR